MKKDKSEIKKNHLQQVRQNTLFSQFSEPDWLHLTPHFSQKSLAKGEMLFQQGDEAHRFYFVIKGNIRLFRLSSDGQEKVVELIKPNQTFSEAVMFAPGRLKRYPINAEATDNTLVLSMHHNPYLKLLHNNPSICFALLSDMSQRLHKLLLEIDRLTLQQSRERLLSFLLQESLSKGTTQPLILLEVTRKVLASRLSVQPETLSRLFRRLKSEGVLEEEGRTIRILKMEALRVLNSGLYD